ncbi:MAG: DUF11 domain-containing protein, partial [Thermoplasmata archaeon]|nr:DUF11 domain-containing protein [Thermoplasmata archaeon]
IDSNGLFTAQTTPAIGFVEAANSTFIDTANVSVIEGEVDYIVLDPNTLTLKVGETQQFTATAYDQYNNIIPDALMFWTTTAGVVNSTGFFTAQTIPGMGFVNVTCGSVTASADVTLLVGDIHHIDVTPSFATVVVGTSQAFTAAAYDAYNNSISGVGFDWTTDVGIVNASGFFTAELITGTGVVTATNGTVTGSANVVVVPGDVDTIVVTPDPANVVAGAVQQFTATAYDQHGNIIPGVSFSWNTDVGSVNSTGLFTAQTTVATGFVEAANSSITGSAVVTVIEGALDHVIVVPDTVSIQVGNTQQFTATGYDVYNNTIAGVSFSWSTDVGTVDATGLFTAQTTPGNGVVEATNGSITGIASVDAITGDVDHIVVEPNPASVMVGETQQFTATAYDFYNNEITGVTFFWSTDLGIVNSAGFFTAFTTARIGFVNATFGPVTGSANVEVVPGVVHHIDVTPSPVSVEVGTQQQFAAQAYDVYNNLITNVTFLWSTNVGVVNFAGLLTAQTTTGSGFVRATIGSINGTAEVSVIPWTLHHITVTPSSVTMSADNERQFTATGYDVYNNVVTISPIWDVDGGGLVNATGYFIAQTVGSWRIYANESNISGFASITITHGAPVSMEITPANATITTDDILLYTATASDADGNSWVATPGTVFTENDPKGTMILNAYYAGQVGTWNVMGNYGGLTDNATVTVLPGAAAFIVLDSPGSVTAGDIFNVTMTVYDADSNVKTDYLGTIGLSSSDPYPAVLPANHTFNASDAGTFTFSGLTLYTRPSQILTAADLSNATLTDSDNITVLSPYIQPEKMAPANAEPGEIITYKIYYNNTGDTVAANVWLNDTLPAGVNFINASGGGVESGGVVRWSFANLLPGIRFVTINVSLDVGLTNGTILTNWVYCNFTALNGIQFPETLDSTDTRIFFLPIIIVAKTVGLVLKDIIVEPDQWGTASAGSTMSYLVNVTNLQGVDDTIDLEYMSLLNWTISFFLDDGVTPLGDTNGNTIPDTGLLTANGGNISIYVDIGIPSSAQVGEEEITYIIGTSFADPNVIDIARLNTTVIQPAGGAILALVIDNSNSMGRDIDPGPNVTTPIDEAKESAKLLINNLTDESVVSIWTFSGTNPSQVLPLTQLAGGGRDVVNASIDSISSGGMTPIWDTIGAAYEDVNDNKWAYPEHIPVVIVLSDGADYQSNDDSAIKLQMLERGSDNWAPWHEMYIGNDSANGYRIVDYPEHKGKYSIPWDTIPGYWYSAGTYGGNLDPRIGLLNSDMLIFTIGLALEHHDPVDQPQKSNWTEAVTDNYSYYTGGVESGTVEYNLWRIANTSGADYFYAPSASELQTIYGQIAGIISQLIGSSATGSKESISAGDSLMYKIFYNNTGIGNAGNVWVNDSLPECLILVGTNASVPWTYVNGQYSWHFTNVTPGTHWFWIEVEIDNTVVDNQTIVNQVFLNYTDSEGNSLPGSSDSANVTVSEPNIEISKIASSTLAEPGDFLNYTIFYNNTGAAMALFVWINDSFDPHVTYISDSAPVAPAANGNNYSWMILGVMPGNYSFNVIVQVLDDTPGGTVIGNLVTAVYTNEDNVIHNESSTSNEVNTSVSNTVIHVQKTVDSG